MKPVEYHHFIQKKRLCAQYINGERQCPRTKVLRVEQKNVGHKLNPAPSLLLHDVLVPIQASEEKFKAVLKVQMCRG